MPNIEDVEHEGEEIFQHFILERIEGAGINRPNEALRIPDGYRTTAWGAVGGNLRGIADEFTQTRGAAEIRQQVRNINLDDIAHERFLEMLNELFVEGFSRERLIALFFFCSYVLIRGLFENREELCGKMFLWSLKFVKDRVCKWVSDHGGWKKVLGTVYDVILKALAVGALTVGIVAGAVYIRKNI